MGKNNYINIIRLGRIKIKMKAGGAQR